MTNEPQNRLGEILLSYQQQTAEQKDERISEAIETVLDCVENLIEPLWMVENLNQPNVNIDKFVMMQRLFAVKESYEYLLSVDQ